MHVCANKEFENREENKEVRESENNIAEVCDRGVENEYKQDPLNLQSKKEPVDDDGHGPYVPGSLTELNNRHESHDILVKEAIEHIHGPQESDADKFWRKVAENAKNNVQASTEMKCDKKCQTPKLPYVNVSQNYQFARKMHVGNLEHQPLPDTLGYRNLTKIGEHRDSDVIIKPYAIGWKGYGASGPTCCTKMRVHRPKTSDSKQIDSIKDANKQRPSTSAPNLGGQYKKPMSLMDLAICWDFRPDVPKSEPKPSKHIDGSNGSKAPAVFTMVHTPNKEIEGNISHANPIFNQNQVGEDFGRHSVPYFEKDMTKEKPKDSCDVQHCAQHINSNGKGSRSSSSNRKSSSQSLRKSQCDGIHGCGTPSDSNIKSNHSGSPDKLQPTKDAREEDIIKHGFKVNRNRHSLDSYDKTSLAQGKVRHSSFNESQISKQSNKDSSSNNIKHKNCLSCNSARPVKESKSKEDYKFAFKAGNPNSVQSVSSTDSKGIKIPQMRHPYTKKSYTIPTLAPPFSIWRDANATGYPEHWRLASVYQHAYKAPEQRRKPLIDSVYQ